MADKNSVLAELVLGVMTEPTNIRVNDRILRDMRLNTIKIVIRLGNNEDGDLFASDEDLHEVLYTEFWADISDNESLYFRDGYADLVAINDDLSIPADRINPYYDTDVAQLMSVIEEAVTDPIVDTMVSWVTEAVDRVDG